MYAEMAMVKSSGRSVLMSSSDSMGTIDMGQTYYYLFTIKFAASRKFNYHASLNICA